MRLIDADDEIAKIEEEIKRYEERRLELKRKMEDEPNNNYNDWFEKIKQYERNVSDCRKEIRMLRSYQTAYDPDKVVEQILNIKVDLFAGRSNGKTLFTKTLSEYRQMVVEKVKRGGVE